eukprot:NODE_3488_length_968_cov_22.619151_g3202_i0.p1 GENE.NODE_3488_length_968_cov_22.619151_g3202_i0~~NODE_3488_length_968_cov_22.619151_g3202_i0.p1  ORF type:complete len:111 (-),score=30.08 NODE_3488_length_968_cov_22.619151_g3202_i0:364-696(-)
MAEELLQSRYPSCIMSASEIAALDHLRMAYIDFSAVSYVEAPEYDGGEGLEEEEDEPLPEPGSKDPDEEAEESASEASVSNSFSINPPSSPRRKRASTLVSPPQPKVNAP